MRAFIGIELPKDVKDYLFELEKELNKLPIKCKFVAKKNLHVTQKFFQDINEKELELVKNKLKEIKFKKFKVILSKIDFFPKKDKARVIWVGLNNADKLFDLQREIDSSLLEVIKMDSQQFQAHVTLGRIKFIKNKEKFNKEVSEIKVNPMKFEINSFQISESILKKDGPIYRIREEYKLT